MSGVSKKTGASRRLIKSTTGRKTYVSYPYGETGKEFVQETFDVSARGRTASAKGKKTRYTHARRGRAVYSK